MNIGWSVTALGGILLAACVHVAPKEGVAPRAVVVEAPFDRVWDVALAEMEARNLPVSIRDRSSGQLHGEVSGLSKQKVTVADCGGALGVGLSPTAARYSLQLKGDSVRTEISVEVTWIFGRLESVNALTCASKGVWEAELGARLKERAETRTTHHGARRPT